ncbi:MAG: uroporphyrinogen-III synthase [Xanthomonadales bacterium]|nr:uroporphyrinogen-III synthase [Xanthomonadales bacterium]
MSSTQVLITRPEPDATLLAGEVEKHGLQPIASPAMAFKPRAAGLDFDCFWQPGLRKLAVFCSPRAVTLGLRQLPAGFLEGAELAAIGPASADQLEAAGLVADILPDRPYNSESMLAHRAISANPGQALLLTAPGGRQRLREGLQDLGWKVTFAFVYETVLLPPGPVVERRVQDSDDIISIWTSARALSHMAASMAPGAWKKVSSGILIVNSDRLARQARAQCSGEVVVAAGPGNDAIMAALLELSGD